MNDKLSEEKERLSAQINGLLNTEKETIIVAIDGRCAAGKTMLAKELMEKYDCNVFHMDDYFLRPEQRTEARLAKPGENVDHERFEEEILIPLSQNREVTFKRFDCKTFTLEAPVTVSKKRLNIVEGVYSMHPELASFYDLTVFYDIEEKLQRERITRRNSAMAEKFFSTWIPLEEKYFKTLDIRQKANIII